MAARTTLLCVLDGFGLNPDPRGNAVHLAKKPNIDRLMASSPWSTLITYGNSVGLPEGQMGNSEVGHIHIGAGRVVEQSLLRIGRGLTGDFLDSSQVYKQFLKNVSGSETIHLVGLYSDGGVHSHAEHLQLLIKRLSRDWQRKIALHLITDGRDCSPNAALGAIEALGQFLKSYPNCVIASVCGRYFAMDRDNRWPRVERAYQAMALAKAPGVKNIGEYVERSYKSGTTDEFLEPAIIGACPIKPQDGIIFWNFRADRMRQLVRALCSSPSLKEFSHFSRPVAPVPAERVICFTDYDDTFQIPYLFAPPQIKNHLGEVISKAGLKQLRVAETEKYPHVTYFFNGGIEEPYPGEDRKLVPSPQDVKTYDLKPEMSAYPVTDIVVSAIKSRAYDFIVVNLANCDMVGHTGVLEAGIKAVETCDACLGKMLAELEAQNGQALIIADHGNAEQMINYEDGSPHTAHTTYPVPVIAYGLKEKVSLRSGATLCDVAPTVLKMIGLPLPSEMTGVPIG